MKNQYTFSKSGKMDTYGMNTKIERVVVHPQNAKALVLVSLPLLPIALVIWTHLPK